MGERLQACMAPYSLASLLHCLVVHLARYCHLISCCLAPFLPVKHTQPSYRQSQTGWNQTHKDIALKAGVYQPIMLVEPAKRRWSSREVKQQLGNRGFLRRGIYHMGCI